MGGLSLAEYLVILTAAGVGAMVQGAVGFGANLIAVPVVALFAPEALPATLVFWAVPLCIVMALREHHGVDWSGVRWMTLGRLPGTAVGVWVVSSVAINTLSVLTGVVVLVAVATSLLTTTLPLTPVTKAAAGFSSGVMGTATSIGGPPMALLYQHQRGTVLRSTLAAAFVVGTATSLTALALAHEIEAWQLRLAVSLLPALAIGLTLSRHLSARLDARWLRPAVLTFAALAAGMAIVRGLG